MVVDSKDVLENNSRNALSQLKKYTGVLTPPLKRKENVRGKADEDALAERAQTFPLTDT